MIQVTAAIIKQQGKVLICQRAEDDEASLFWEFPGGKLEKGETLEQCIIREIKEELNLDIKINNIFIETDYFYGGKQIHFAFFDVSIIGGKLKLNVHNDAVWAPINTLKRYNFLPADLVVVDKLLEVIL